MSPNTLGQPVTDVKIIRVTAREAEIRTAGNFKGVCLVKVGIRKKTYTYKLLVE
jgi:hypothetical protein